jgi:DNA-binding NtrC family response regulator
MGRRMLLVEDDELVQRALVEMLVIAGWFVTSVSTGAEVLQSLRRETVPFDVLVTDLSLPGMTGCELGSQASAEYPGLKIILVSGYASVEQAPGKEPFEVLAKPFSVEQLEAAISRQP